MKKQMKQVAAATLAALCFGAVAIPTVVSAATITVTSDESNIIAMGSTTVNAYRVFEVSSVTDGTNTVLQVVGSSVTPDVAAVFAGKMTNLTDAEKADMAKAAASRDADLQASWATKIGDYLSDLDDNSDELNALARALVGKVGAAVATQTGATSVSLDVGNVAGYYLLTGTTTEGSETVLSSVMMEAVDGTVQNVNVTLKADKPTIEKYIVENSDLVKANTAGVGEKVEYQLKTQVPDTTYYSEYYLVMRDTLSAGLTYDGNAVVTIEGKTVTPGTDYNVYSAVIADDPATTTVNEACTLINIVFNEASVKAWGTDSDGDGTADESWEGLDIVVTYTATVNENAKIGAEGNPNVVDLSYSNNPNVDSDWADTDGDGNPDDTDENDTTPETPPATPDEDNPTETTPPDEVKTYLTQLQIVKKDETGTLMTSEDFDIEFTITGTNHGVSYTVKVDGGVVTVSETNLGKELTATTGVTAAIDENGQITFSGLTADTYTISETKTPADYIKANDIVVTITADFGETQDSSTAAPTWTYADGITETDDVNDASNVFTVINRRGTTLPSTGGIGTTIFTVVGLSLMATATGAYLIKRKVTAQ